MTTHTKKFLKAYEPIKQMILAAGEVTPEARLAFRDAMLKLGHLERVRNLYRIQNKLDKKAVLFAPNKAQSDYLRARKGRDIVLKTRQLGFTTLSCVRALDYALWEPGTRTGIMAHKENVVKTIFEDLVKFTYSWFKKDWSHLYNPEQRSDSATALGFEEDGIGRQLNSSMRVLFDFRGKTVNFLHVSEASRIEADRLLGSLQGVPATGEVILESTPNGKAGEFYRQWQLWRTNGELAPYRGHFFPWYQQYPEEPEKWTLPSGIELTIEERRLKDEYKLKGSHLAWRRWCIEANCLGEPEKFENEYPSNDIDCFYTGENQVFGGGILKYQDKFALSPTRRGWLASEGDAKVTFHDDTDGSMWMWEPPVTGNSYVIGVDPSQGVGKDRGAAYVLNQYSGKIVARIAGQFAPADLADDVWKLAQYYNKAWVCVEVNNHGHLVQHVLIQKAYKNLYKRKTIDQITNKPATEFGFFTSNDTKLMITERFKEAAKTGAIRISDPELLSEMSTFVQIASKVGGRLKREAASGAADDLVMAACLTWEMHLQRGVNIGFLEESLQTADESDIVYDADTGLPF